MKVAVVGGGSTYTPELVDGFARLRDLLPVEELVLVDPDQERLDLVGGVSERILAKQGHPGRLVRTTDLDQALDGAVVVLIQLRVGGQAARNVRRDVAAGVRLRGAGDHRGRWARQGAAHRAGRARHRRAGARAGPTTRGSSTSPTRSGS